MTSRTLPALLCLLTVLQVGCASTSSPPQTQETLGVSSEPREIVRFDDLRSLLDHGEAEARFSLCETEPGSGECIKPAIGLFGLGGFVLPIRMKVSELRLRDLETSDTDATARATFRTRVNGIPPACRATDLTLRSSEGTTSSFEISPFYCNWMLIGNVRTKVKLTLDGIDLERRELTGTYEMRINGTANGKGKGHFLARLESHPS